MNDVCSLLRNAQSSLLYDIVEKCIVSVLIGFVDHDDMDTLLITHQ